ncbi:GNAT family N-acetyltransferase [Robbsia andropogonis]|uniref:GNAT family N-acetyltransferase n=1 Tax=Robbsia andropogonis TaxID=28092 RepID=UPI0004AE7220|nr:GNAT family N-acetyltransferase [Robbsia andropogonis]
MLMHAPKADTHRQASPLPADAAPLAAAMRALDAADWHSSSVLVYLPSLLKHAEALAPSHRAGWLIGLNRCWEHHHAAFDSVAKRTLLTLAAAWSYWPLVLAVGDTLTPFERREPDVLSLVGHAYHLTGDVDAAIDMAVIAQLAEPGHPGHAAAYRNLIAWRNWRRSLLPMHSIGNDDAMLYLEPLGHHHVADFCWQYYDPAIAEWCGLPHFHEAAAWHRWLDAGYAQGDQQFAVIHRAWGFIGNVGLTPYRDIGFFYYWIGRDFQGHGFGSSAAALLIEAAHRHRCMRTCYATVYETNTASRRALEKIGFIDTGVRGSAPHDNHLFYRIGQPNTQARIACELHTLTDWLDLDVRAAVPLTSRDT